MNEPEFFTCVETGVLLSRHSCGGYIDNAGKIYGGWHPTIPMSKQIAIDFDGVIHSYTSGWKGASVISDPPIDGAFDAIRTYLQNGIRVSVFSTRNVEPGAVDAMLLWFHKYGMEDEHLNRLTFPTSKPSTASVFIADRAYLFEGTFPTVEYLKEFKPWNKK